MTEAEKERAAVIAFLMDEDADNDALVDRLIDEILKQHRERTFCAFPFFKLLAVAIESGEHLKEGR